MFEKVSFHQIVNDIIQDWPYINGMFFYFLYKLTAHGTSVGSCYRYSLFDCWNVSNK